MSTLLTRTRPNDPRNLRAFWLPVGRCLASLASWQASSMDKRNKFNFEIPRNPNTASRLKGIGAASTDHTWLKIELLVGNSGASGHLLPKKV